MVWLRYANYSVFGKTTESNQIIPAVLNAKYKFIGSSLELTFAGLKYQFLLFLLEILP